MFGLLKRERSAAKGPKGRRAYVIGDIHGRLDLLEQLLAEIERDIDLSRPGKTLLVFLGDLIDRGPHSAQVIERLRTYRREGVQTVFLLGNHEEVLLRILDGDAPLIAKWRSFGGAECLASYGVNPATMARLDDNEALAEVRRAIPAQHIAFLRKFADTCRFGDYLFVHAGIRPGVELDRQKQSDLRWIRDPFLGDDADHGFVVVHGHTISNGVEDRPNRIGIDTGAYRTGVLTALVIDGEQRRFLTTGPAGAGRASATH
ncbi:calcineurin-like phosphoesterase family protein [Sphingomonas sp. F9_3S_D5_B_2]